MTEAEYGVHPLGQGAQEPAAQHQGPAGSESSEAKGRHPPVSAILLGFGLSL